MEPHQSASATGSVDLYCESIWPVRAEITAAHSAWLRHVATPGTWWTGEQRVAFVTALWAALDDPAPLPPWESPAPPAASPLPAVAHEMSYRLARHAATTTQGWYQRTCDALSDGAAAFVELAALAATGCAVGTFGPALGVERPALLNARPGDPSRERPPTTDATTNWVPVTPPADERAAVVQAFSAVPAEYDMLWQLASAQYMSIEDMAHLDWRRPGSPLHRRQLELVAARLSIVRECFY